ncbi:MAG: cache domain-containing protein, partial [Desulfobacterales bacterium]
MAFTIRRYPFYIVMTILVVAIVFSLSALFLWISHRESKAAAVRMADRLFSEINEKTLERYERALEAVAVLAGTAVRVPGMATRPEGDGRSHPGLELMLEALAFYEYLYSLYTGYDDGSFIQIIAVRDKPELRRLFGAPQGTFYVLRAISADPPETLQQRWVFLDKGRQALGARGDPEPDYDPRARLWYTRARAEETTFYTEPYIFSSAKMAGITCARKLLGGGGVFGADITLDRFALSLERQKISAHGMLFLFDRTGRIIAHPKENPIKSGKGETLQFLSGDESGDPLVRAVVAGYRADPDRGFNR